MEFPVYLKFQNNKHFYKIISSKSFEEITVIGARYEKHLFEAKIYPDILRIQDMLNNEQGVFLEIGEEEYISAEKKC